MTPRQYWIGWLCGVFPVLLLVIYWVIRTAVADGIRDALGK